MPISCLQWNISIKFKAIIRSSHYLQYNAQTETCSWRRMVHHMCIGIILGIPFVVTTFGITKLALDYFVKKWDTPLESISARTQENHIQQIHLKLENVKKAIEQIDAVVDAIIISQGGRAATSASLLVKRESQLSLALNAVEVEASQQVHAYWVND